MTHNTMATKTQNTRKANKAPTNNANATNDAKATATVALTMQGMRATVGHTWHGVKALVKCNFAADFVKVENDIVAGKTALAMVASGAKENATEIAFHGKYAVQAVNALTFCDNVRVQVNTGTAKAPVWQTLQGVAPKGYKAPIATESAK